MIKAINVLLLSRLNPKENDNSTYLTGRLKYGIKPAEILTDHDLFTASLLNWAKNQQDPINAIYDQARKFTLNEYDTEDIERARTAYNKIYNTNMKAEQFYNFFHTLSPLDKSSLLINMKPLGLRDAPEVVFGVLTSILGIAPKYSFLDLLPAPAAR